MATSFSTSIPVLTPTGITVNGTGNLTVSSTAAGPLVARTLSPKLPNEPIYAEFNIITANATAGNDGVGLQFTPTTVPAQVIALCGVVGSNEIWASVDGGNTWNGSGTPNPGTGTDPNVYSVTGAVHFALSLYSNLDAATVNFGQGPFVGTPPSGFSAWGSSETFDSALAGSNLVIGPDNVSVYNPTGGWNTVLTTGSKTSGSWYLEIYLYSQPESGLIVGVGNASTNLSSYAGNSSNSAGWQIGTSDEYGTWSSGPGFPSTSSSVEKPTQNADTGQIVYNSNGDYTPSAGSLSESGLPTWTSGATVGVAFSPTYGVFWTTDGVNWNKTSGSSGNPVSGSGGFTAPGGAVQFLIEYEASGSEITLNPTGSFVFSPPFGYSPWDGGAPAGGASNWVNVACVC